MKPALRKVTPNPESSFIVRRDHGKGMRNNWHYHPEFELLYIKRSSGTWLVGDYIGHFKSGDVVLIGSNLPHSFRHEYEYVEERDNQPGEAIVVLFLKDILGPPFLSLPEAKEISNLLTLAGRGLKVNRKAKAEVADMIDKMQYATPGKKLIILLTALNLIGESKEYTALSSQGFTYNPNEKDNDRLNTIFEYTYSNFSGKISLEEVASLLNMTKYSFCRYFKSKTRKTYIQFLMEVRIGQACRLLVEEDLTVTEVCYSCGYNNISHFYNQFIAITGKKPLQYKRNYLQAQ